MFQFKRRRNILGKITSVFGIDRNYQRIFLHHTKSIISFDVENPDEFLLDSDIKNPNSVAHGNIGDVVFTKLDQILSKHPPLGITPILCLSRITGIKYRFVQKFS